MVMEQEDCKHIIILKSYKSINNIKKYHCQKGKKKNNYG